MDMASSIIAMDDHPEELKCTQPWTGHLASSRGVDGSVLPPPMSEAPKTGGRFLIPVKPQVLVAAIKFSHNPYL